MSSLMTIRAMDVSRLVEQSDDNQSKKKGHSTAISGLAMAIRKSIGCLTLELSHNSCSKRREKGPTAMSSLTMAIRAIDVSRPVEQRVMRTIATKSKEKSNSHVKFDNGITSESQMSLAQWSGVIKTIARKSS